MEKNDRYPSQIHVESKDVVMYHEDSEGEDGNEEVNYLTR